MGRADEHRRLPDHWIQTRELSEQLGVCSDDFGQCLDSRIFFELYGTTPVVCLGLHVPTDGDHRCRSRRAGNRHCWKFIHRVDARWTECDCFRSAGRAFVERTHTTRKHARAGLSGRAIERPGCDVVDPLARFPQRTYLHRSRIDQRFSLFVPNSRADVCRVGLTGGRRVDADRHGGYAA